MLRRITTTIKNTKAGVSRHQGRDLIQGSPDTVVVVVVVVVQQHQEM